MRWEFAVVCSLSTMQIVAGVILMILYSRQTDDLHHSKFLGILAIDLSAVACFISGWCLLTECSSTALIISTLFCLSGLAFLYPYCRWCVRYDARQIELRPCFSHKQLFQMAEASGLTEGQFTTVLHFPNGKLRLYGSEEKREWLVEEVQKYSLLTIYGSTTRSNEPLRKLPATLKDYGVPHKEYLAVAAVLLLAIECLICINVSTIHIASKDQTQVALNDYRVEWTENKLNISTQENDRSFYLAITDLDLSQARFSALQDAFQSGKPLTIYVERDGLDRKNNAIRICALEQTGGQILISRQEIMATQWNYLTTIILLGILLLLMLAMCGVACFAASHKEKFPILYEAFAVPKVYWKTGSR